MILQNIQLLLMFLAYLIQRPGRLTLEEKCRTLEWLGRMAANPDQRFALGHISEQPGQLRYTRW